MESSMRGSNINYMQVHLQWEDGRQVNVYSPEKSKGELRKKLGWFFVLLGGWIMFGRRKDWRTYLNCSRQ